MQTANSKHKNPATAESGIGKLDLEVFVSLLFTHRKTWLLSLLATVAAAAIFSLAAPKQYEATSKILAEPIHDDSPYVLEARGQQERRVFRETQKELLVSDTVLRATLAALNSAKSGEVTQRQVDELAGKISVRSREGMGRSVFSSDGIGETNTFFVIVRDGDPENAARIANTLVDNYMKVAAGIRGEQVSTAAASLELSVADTSARVKEAHQKLAGFEMEAGSILPELMNVDKASVRVFPELESLREDFQVAQVELEERRARADALRQVLKGYDKTKTPALPPDLVEAMPPVKTLLGKIVDLTMELNELRPFYGEEAREIRSLREQIEYTREELLEMARVLMVSEEQAIGILEATQTARAASLAEYDVKLSRLSEMNSRYAELKRDYQSQARALERQIELLAETKAVSSQNQGRQINLAVIDAAFPNPDPVAPRPVRNVLLAIPIGLLLGIVLLLLNQLARPIFVHPRQLAQSTGLPVVGVMNR